MSGSKRDRENLSGLGAEDEDSPSKRSPLALSEAQDAMLGALSDHQQGFDTALSPSHPSQPPQIPLLSPRALQGREVLHQLAATAVKYWDAQSQARFVKEVQADDELAEVAYRRGLLVTFSIFPSITAQRPIPIEAPEFASVAYLKRRIFKAKLLNREFCPPERFSLRRRAAVDAPGGSATRDPLSEETAQGTPMLLFALGFYAGTTYEMTMISKPQTTDKEQQESMLQGLGLGGTGPVVPSTDANVRKYQELLQGRPLPNFVPQSVAGRYPVAGTPAVPAAPRLAEVAGVPGTAGRLAGAAGGVARPSAAVPGTAAVTLGALPSPEVTNVAAVGVARVPSRSPRQIRAGRWSAGEIEALVMGVQAFGQVWSKIEEHYAGRGIHPLRTTTDYKDKWRNLVKLCADPSKQPRTVGLTDQLRDTMLRLANTPTTRDNSGT